MAGALRELRLSYSWCLQGMWAFQSIDQPERIELPGPERLERVRCAWQSKQVLGSEAELWRKITEAVKMEKEWQGRREKVTMAEIYREGTGNDLWVGNEDKDNRIFL